MTSKSLTVFAPATVANVGPGYDVLGFALESYGDTLTLTERSDSGLVINRITGATGIPLDSKTNVATVAMKAMLDSLKIKKGFDIELAKNIPPGSGLGSSASSSAAAVYALNLFLGKPLSEKQLVPFAMEGEKAASSKAHADNVAPSIMGGFTAVRSYDPLDIISISYPRELMVSIVYPDIEIKTSDAKKILKPQLELSQAVQQWGNVAALIAGLTSSDMDLIGRSLQDVVVEPIRSILIPFFKDVKEIAMSVGALGFSISGSGPSMFALTENSKTAEAICEQAKSFYEDNDIKCMVFTSSINNLGARQI